MPAALEPEFQKHILGVQGQLWTEYLPTPKAVEYSAFPRLTALAEVGVDADAAARDRRLHAASRDAPRAAGDSGRELQAAVGSPVRRRTVAAETSHPASKLRSTLFQGSTTVKAQTLTVALILTLAAAVGRAQQPTPPPATFESYVTTTWKALHNKILDMAKDFPEDKYSWKPHPDSRTMVEEFRHVTLGLEMSTAEMRGDKFDYGGRMKADETKPKTRESVVREMEAAIAASYALVEKTPKPRLVWWIDHQAEHYGKLVSNYRMNGLVPPISRVK